MTDIFEQYGIFPDEDQHRKLLQYCEILLEWNKKINLTTIVEKEEVFWKHFLDSALIMKSKLWQKEKEESILDIGTGAGFPGMVLAILNPKKKFILLDSLNKRIDFLKCVIEKLQLENVKVFHGRAETYGRMEKFRNKFDFVVSRAVAELPVLMEYCIPFVKTNGYFVSYKGKKQEEELSRSEHALTELTARFDHLEQFELEKGEKRFLLFIENCSKTNEKYPRKEGKPKKKPL